LATRTKLYLDSIDAWIMAQASLVNGKRRSVLAVVRERQQLADALARYLQALGLERRRERVTDLDEYLRERYGGNVTAPAGTPLPSRPAEAS
jgi:hypothetical protein